jgi:GntR family transcriptional regulator
MFERIDPRSSTPLYAQISARLRMAIAARELAAGAALPSVRQLAAQLRINPATVVQAYRELENEGLVATRHGAGTFVLDVTTERRASERATEARRLVRDLLADAGRAGISAADLRAAFEHELKGGRTE